MLEFDFQKKELYTQILDYIKRMYAISRKFPSNELYGLTSQIQRASSSIALNFAEGWGRHNVKEKCQFYRVARASIFECVSIMDISRQQNYVEDLEYNEIITISNELSTRLCSLIKTLQN